MDNSSWHSPQSALPSVFDVLSSQGSVKSCQTKQCHHWPSSHWKLVVKHQSPTPFPQDNATVLLDLR